MKITDFSRKAIAALLLGAMLTAAAATSGCAEKAESGGSTSVVTQAEQTEETTVDIYADLPTGNYDGYNFRVINNISNFALTQFDADELDGEAVNDAVYQRNRLIEDKLNISISEDLVDYSVVNSTMKSSLAAAEDAYDIFFNELHFVIPFGSEGSLYNIYDVEGLELEKEWWDQKVINSLTIGNTLYVLCGEFHFMLQESAWTLGFNKKIQQDYNVEDLYAAVNDGTWTFEAMNTAMNQAAVDLDGDGAWTAADQFGATAYGGVVYPMVISSGEQLIKRDADNIPYYAGITDRFVNVYTDIVNIMFDNAGGAIFMDGKVKGLTGGQTWHDMFIDGKTLFYCEVMGSLKKLRQMDNEFGIIPFPKFDDTQDHYTTLTASYAACMGIPITNPDTERTGVIIENLCAESYRSVRSVYYDILLEGKYIRDNESSAMLDIIFGNRVFALEQIFGWGSLAGKIGDNAAAKKTEIASVIAKIEEKVVADLDKTVAFYTGN